MNNYIKTLLNPLDNTIKTKRSKKGEYKVYREGGFAGTISNFPSGSNQWITHNEHNEYIGTLDTKKDCLLMFF
jgi:hypothetical protein